MKRLFFGLAGVSLLFPILLYAQSSGTVNLSGPSTGGSTITPATINSAVNTALQAKQDYNGNASGTSVTSNSITNTLTTWMSYLSGTGNPNRMLIQPTAASTSTDNPNLNSIRTATHSGGMPGYVVANQRAATTAPA